MEAKRKMEVDFCCCSREEGSKTVEKLQGRKSSSKIVVETPKKKGKRRCRSSRKERSKTVEEAPGKKGVKADVEAAGKKGLRLLWKLQRRRE